MRDRDNDNLVKGGGTSRLLFCVNVDATRRGLVMQWPVEKTKEAAALVWGLRLSTDQVMMSKVEQAKMYKLGDYVD